MNQLAPLSLVLLATASGNALATQYLSPEQAQQVIFPEATLFKAQPVQLTLDQMKQVEKLAAVPARSVSWRVVQAYKDDKLLGYIFFDDVIGKFELISYAVGLQADGLVRQVEIMAYRESHGFEIRNANWRKQFIGKNAGAGMQIGDGIANISGATLSCSHVTDGVRRIAAIVQVLYKK
ncbi:FMN-binding protein [Undibacterium rugosum]|uniref:FMN-binding protein n=1 Tax=Undibacterium rugosum TaxID=2762291 RepID=A0A923ICA7_9BURK|nr:FMN-binding protein [Undibacterium rugosum]MBC3936765.1 FMN-binding protein [Undibacterium rugosum]MBR7780195.1 FMN-binding protein [Undibacterium rugosum]